MSILVFMSFYFGWLKNFFKWQTLSFFSPRKFFKIPDMISLSLPKTGFFYEKNVHFHANNQPYYYFIRSKTKFTKSTSLSKDVIFAIFRHL